MNSLVENARKVERELSAEKGPFTLFVAISRIVIVEPESPEVQAINRAYPAFDG